jgi:hypothetical protein
MAAGASPSLSDGTLIVVDNDFERRYFYSATTATRGLGWLIWPNNPMVRRGQMKAGEVKVYRLDTEASATLTQALLAASQKTDPHTGQWAKATIENFKTIIQNCTGIRR